MRGAAAAADDETRCVKSGRRGEPAKRTAANYEASGRQGQAGKFLDQTRARSRKPPAARGEARRAAEQRSPRRARACAPANRNRAFLPLRPSGYGGWLEARGRPAARPTGGIASRGWCRREPRPAPPGTSRSRAPAGRPAPSALLSCRPASPRERTRARTARHTGHERTRVRGVVGADSGADRSISHVMSGGKKAWDLFSARVLFCGFGIGNSLLHASGVSFLGAVSWLVSTETTMWTCCMPHAYAGFWFAFFLSIQGWACCFAWDQVDLEVNGPWDFQDVCIITP